MNNNASKLFLTLFLLAPSLIAMQNANFRLPPGNSNAQQQNNVDEQYLVPFYYQIADFFSPDYTNARIDILNTIRSLNTRLPLHIRPTTRESIAVMDNLFSQGLGLDRRAEAIIALANHMISIAHTMSPAGPRRQYRNQFNRLVASLESLEQRELLHQTMDEILGPRVQQRAREVRQPYNPRPLIFD